MTATTTAEKLKEILGDQYDDFALQRDETSFTKRLNNNVLVVMVKRTDLMKIKEKGLDSTIHCGSLPTIFCSFDDGGTGGPFYLTCQSIANTGKISPEYYQPCFMFSLGLNHFLKTEDIEIRVPDISPPSTIKVGNPFHSGYVERLMIDDLSSILNPPSF